MRLHLFALLAILIGLASTANARPRAGSNDGCADPNSHVVHDDSEENGYRCDCNAGFVGVEDALWGSRCVTDPGGAPPSPPPVRRPPGDPRIPRPRPSPQCLECRAHRASCLRQAKVSRDQCQSFATPRTARQLCEQGRLISGDPPPPGFPQLAPFQYKTVEDRTKCLHWSNSCDRDRELCIPREAPLGGGGGRDISRRCTLRPGRCTRTCDLFGTKRIKQAGEVCMHQWQHGIFTISGGTVTVPAFPQLGVGASVTISKKTGLLGFCDARYQAELLTCNGQQYNCTEVCARN